MHPPKQEEKSPPKGDDKPVQGLVHSRGKIDILYMPFKQDRHYLSLAIIREDVKQVSRSPGLSSSISSEGKPDKQVDPVRRLAKGSTDARLGAGDTQPGLSELFSQRFFLEHLFDLILIRLRQRNQGDRLDQGRMPAISQGVGL